MFVVRTGCWFLSHMFFLLLIHAKHCSVRMKASVPNWKILLFKQIGKCDYSIISTKAALSESLDSCSIISRPLCRLVLCVLHYLHKVVITASWLYSLAVTGIVAVRIWGLVLTVCEFRYVTSLQPTFALLWKVTQLHAAWTCPSPSTLSAEIHVYYKSSHTLAHFSSHSPCLKFLIIIFNF